MISLDSTPVLATTYTGCANWRTVTNPWTGQAITPGSNQRYANLNGMDLSCADLSGVDFYGAVIGGNIWTNSNLTSTNFGGTSYCGGIFTGADIAGSNLTSTGTWSCAARVDTYVAPATTTTSTTTTVAATTTTTTTVAPTTTVARTTTTTTTTTTVAQTTTTTTAPGTTTTVALKSSGTTTTVARTVATTTTTSIPTTIAKSTSTTIRIVKDDGQAKNNFANIGINKSGSTFKLSVFSSFPRTKMMLRASKSRAKSVIWKFKTDKNGNYRIATSRALKGFTMSLWIDGDKWASRVVR